jgi:acyl-coenzyme A synthetase/AMP-(fatty) acid ligase
VIPIDYMTDAVKLWRNARETYELYGERLNVCASDQSEDDGYFWVKGCSDDVIRGASPHDPYWVKHDLPT